LLTADAMPSRSSPSASDDFDLLPCNFSIDFLYLGANRGIDVPSAESPGTIFFILAHEISIAPFGGL